MSLWLEEGKNHLPTSVKGGSTWCPHCVDAEAAFDDAAVVEETGSGWDAFAWQEDGGGRNKIE